jgi:hypothetical protein
MIAPTAGMHDYLLTDPGQGMDLSPERLNRPRIVNGIVDSHLAEYQCLLCRVHLLIGMDAGESESADTLRNAMQLLERNMTEEEIAYMREFSAQLTARREGKATT